MREQKLFHTTTIAEFRELAEAARSAGRLTELMEAITDRLERYRVALQSHQLARDFQSIQQAKNLIANLESKLQIAQQLQNPDSQENNDTQIWETY